MVGRLQHRDPHDSLRGLTPAEFRLQNDPATSNLAWQWESTVEHSSVKAS